MKNKLIKAVRTIADFNLNLFNELNLRLKLQDFTEPCLIYSSQYTFNLPISSFMDFTDSCIFANDNIKKIPDIHQVTDLTGITVKN